MLTRLTISSLCILTICNISYFPFSFGFEGWIWVLIASVPDLCIHLNKAINGRFQSHFSDNVLMILN